MPSTSKPILDVGKASPELLPGLRLLRDAAVYARDVEQDIWEFAVSAGELRELGLSSIHLRWLHLRGLVEIAKELTLPGDAARTFRAWQRVVDDPALHVILSPAGETALNEVLSALPIQTAPETPTIDPAVKEPEPEVPRWDAACRELRFQGQLVKRFRVLAPNQETILEAFEEERWPRHIDDPLPPVDDQVAKERLHATLKALNRHQIHALLRFRGNGNGRILWEPMPGS